MRHQKKILLVIMAAIACLLIYSLTRTNPHKTALDTYKKQLAAQGEKMTLAEIAPHVTQAEESGARDLINAIAVLGTFTEFDSGMNPVAPGRAMVSWAEDTLPGHTITNIWPALTPRILEHREDFADIRAAIRNPKIRFNLDYSQGFSVPLPYLAKLKQTEIWLGAATLVELHEHQPSNAFEDLKACIGLLRPLASEPLEISQLVRIAIGQLAINTTWEFLQYPGVKEAQLRELQAQWSATNFFNSIAASLEMERAMMPSAYDLARNSYTHFHVFKTLGSGPPPTSFGAFLSNPANNFGAFMDTLGQYPAYRSWCGNWSYAEEFCALRGLEAALECVRAAEATGTFFPASKKMEAQLWVLTNEFAVVTNHFAFHFMDWGVRSYMTKLSDMEMARRMMITAIALKRFQLRSGEYPSELKELVPDIMPEVPVDFMDGKPLRYHPNADGTFLLYSVGEDGEDNGGDPTPKQSSSQTSLAWWKARDVVWPMPATPEQVRAYKQKAINEIKPQPSLKPPSPKPILETNLPPATNTN